MDSRISGRPCCMPVPPSFTGDALQDGETAVPASGWPFPAPMLDGSSPLEVSVTRSPPTVRLAGDIDEQTYPDLIKALATVAAMEECRIRIDLADVEYCDLAGLRAMIVLAERREDGRPGVEQLVLAHLPGGLRTVLRIVGWDTTLGLILED